MNRTLRESSLESMLCSDISRIGSKLRRKFGRESPDLRREISGGGCLLFPSQACFVLSALILSWVDDNMAGERIVERGGGCSGRK